jgi:competence protein ComEC
MSERDPGIVTDNTRSDAAGHRQSRWALQFGGGRTADRLGAAWLGLSAIFAREMEAGRGFLWLPVLFGAGIVIYFVLPAEPSAIALLLAASVLAVVARRSRDRVALFRVLTAVTAVAAGVTVAKLRTELVAAPVLPREMTANVTGWVAEREASARGGVRVLLKVRDMEHLASIATPDTVRITIRSKAASIAVGDAISVLARLRPPAGPVLPGGYDFARADFYQGVGGSGFAYGAAKPADIGEAPLGIRLAMPVAHLRQTIRDRIIAALPGDNGQIAAALVMGDRRGISEATQEAMRASGLGHILAISGLHMALVAGAAFWLIRALLALSPTLAINRPIRKWAAATALGVAAFYLAISGSGVATERAFVMLAIMLVAVMVDRRAITLRNVALAALVVLLIEPESVLTASFQMSFAATLALVAGYEAIRDRVDRTLIVADLRERGVTSRFWLSTRGLLLTSLIAGLATTPFAIYHFQRAAPLTLFANLAAMPVVGLIVMPMAFFAVLLMPFGLEQLPLTVMGWGLDWVVAVARTTADWSAGWGGVPMAPVSALLLVVAGFLWLALWRERWRLGGLAPIAVAVPILFLTPRPDILVDESGLTAAVRGDDGRYRMVNGKENRFAVENWLRADADPRPVAEALSEGARCDPIGCVVERADGSRVAVSLDPAAFADDCHLAKVVISRFAAPRSCSDTAFVIDRDVLANGGAEALYSDEGNEGDKPSFRVETAYPPQRRPFMPPLRDDDQ